MIKLHTKPARSPGFLVDAYDDGSGEVFQTWHIDGVCTARDGGHIQIWRRSDGTIVFYHFEREYAGLISDMLEGWYDTDDINHADYGWCECDNWDPNIIKEHVLDCADNGKYEYCPDRPGDAS